MVPDGRGRSAPRRIFPRPRLIWAAPHCLFVINSIFVMRIGFFSLHLFFALSPLIYSPSLDFPPDSGGPREPFWAAVVICPRKPVSFLGRSSGTESVARWLADESSVRLTAPSTPYSSYLCCVVAPRFFSPSSFPLQTLCTRGR